MMKIIFLDFMLPTLVSVAVWYSGYRTGIQEGRRRQLVDCTRDLIEFHANIVRALGFTSKPRPEKETPN